MRKNDIKPGVIYAYQRSRGDWETPTPIVFLTAPADGILYNTASMYKKPIEPQYIRAREGSKPQRGSAWNGRDCGYAAVQGDWQNSASPQDLLKPTLDGFGKATDYLATGVAGARFALVTSLTSIVGEYAEVMADKKIRDDAAARQREQDEAKRQAIHARSADVIARLNDFDARPVNAATPCPIPHIKLTLDDAEELLTLLESLDRAVNAPED